MPQSLHPTSNELTDNMQSGARVALIGMIVNILLGAAKVTAGLLGNSYVLIADGIESVLDIGGSIVIWGGLKFAARPPDATHPYGHGKAEPMAAGFVALGVIAAAIGLGIQSLREIFLPHHASAPFTLVVLILVVAVKEVLYRSVIQVGKSVESWAVQTDAWHHRADALTSVAAFIGISIALIGGEAWRSADAWAAVFACTIIAANGCRLLFPAVREMLDTAPQGDIVTKIKSAAVSVPNFRDWRAQNQSFSDMVIWSQLNLNLSGSGAGEPERVRVTVVSENQFSALNLVPAAGRFFIPEDVNGPGNICVISYGLWQRRFGGDPNLLGRDISLNLRPKTVIGVAPPGFSFPVQTQNQTDVWVPWFWRHIETETGRDARAYSAAACRRTDRGRAGRARPPRP